MTEMNPLPTRQYKKVVVKESTKKDKDWVNKENPWFCPCKDPETGEKCGRVLTNWDQLFFNQYGMCEKCFAKYNSHIDGIQEKIENVKEMTE